MIDFKNEVLKIKDDLLKDIIDLCAIPSVQDDATVQDGMPFGKPCKDALDAMLEIGKRDGYVVENVDGYAGHIDIGSGATTFGVLGHLDVVPVNPIGWDSDPFKVDIRNDVLYGRGVADDKGPLLAAYYATKIIDKLNLPTKSKTRIIFGCNEELGSACLKYYFTKRPYPESGFTPDAEFPIVYGEKAGCSATITGTAQKDGLISLCAGDRLNIVPETCTAIVEGEVSKYRDSLEAFVNDHPITATIETEGNHTVITMTGKSAHASTPEEGINSVAYMAKYLTTVTSNQLVSFLDKHLSCYHGRSLGVAHTGEMGPFTLNVGVITYRKDRFEIAIDMRCPHDMDFDKLEKAYQDCCATAGFEVDLHIGKALYVDPTSDLIVNLHKAYTTITGDTTPPQCIGGGTYAKTMPNCVAFGAGFIGEDNAMHQNNENIKIDSLLKATEIYAHAIYDMIKA